MEFAFETAPTVGYVHERYGNRYELIEAKPYVRKLDGRPSFLLTWRGHCPKCLQPFNVRTGLTIKSLPRRCELHRDPRSCATPEAKAARRRGKAKGRAVQKAKRFAAKHVDIGDLLA